MKILFVSHDASRTGAPIILLNILKWLKGHTHHQIECLVLAKGDLLPDFESICYTYPIRQSLADKYSWLLKKFINGKLGTQTNRKRVLSKKYDLIYINTIAGIRFLDLWSIGHPEIPVILHVHELTISIKQFCNEDSFIRNIDRINHFIAASNAVKNNLIENYLITDDDISTIYEPIDIHTLTNTLLEEPIRLRQYLKLPEDAFLVGGSGTRDWRKGIDIFIRTAERFKSKPVYFVWIGGNNSGYEYEQLLYDINRLGLFNKVFLIEAVPVPIKYYNNFNLFFLSSREDPFPLVCLENALCGNPIVCFNNSGGMPEFISQGAGVVLPYMDIDSTEKAILSYFNSVEKLTAHGEIASSKVNLFDLKHFMVKVDLLMRNKLNLNLLNVQN